VSEVTEKNTVWAVPDETQDETWPRMTRDQQLAAYQERFASPGCSTSTDTSVAEVVERTRAVRSTNQQGNDQKL